MLRRMPKARLPMDTRPIKPYITMDDISSKYNIPLSTLYNYNRSDHEFPSPYKRMTNALGKLAFETSRIELWYNNHYLKYDVANSKSVNKVISNLLADLI